MRTSGSVTMENQNPDQRDKPWGLGAAKAAAVAFTAGLLFDLVIFLVQLASSPENPWEFLASPAPAAVFLLVPFLCAATTLLGLSVLRRSAKRTMRVPFASADGPSVLERSLETGEETGVDQPPEPVEEARRLAEVAAREIKHPLTSIVGYSLTLRHYWDKLSEEERREFVDFIHISSIRLEGMVNDLARIMELSRGQKKREGEVLDLEETAQEVAQILSEVHRGRKVTLSLRFPREKVRVKSDPVSLFDLLYNLFDMCMRASADKTVVSAWFNLLDGKVVIRLRCPRVQFHPSRISHIENWTPEGDSDELATLGMQYRLSHLMIREMGGRLNLSELGENGISVQAHLPAPVPSGDRSPN
ncbi:MAG: HAMP domain-containing sensor histidine kinase [Candidatus Geothermincolales bacterium]